MRSYRILVPVLVVFVMSLLVGGCRNGDEPSPEVPTAMPKAMGGPNLTVIKPVVQYREHETDEPSSLGEGEEIEVQAGANVLVSENGRAALLWPDFLTNELLSGTDSLLSLSEPDIRSAILDQAAGTARYILAGAGEPADLQVVANWIEITVEEGEADFIVSFIPGAVPSAWLAVLDGQVAVARGDDTLTVGPGQAMAVTEKGDLPEAMDVDATAIEAWYDQVADGSAEGDIATVAMRCVVTADEADFLSEPDDDADEAGDPLTGGTVVNVLQRDGSGDWLFVTPLAAVRGGWVAVDDLSCNGPAGSAPSEGADIAPVEEGATPTYTATARPRVTFTPSATYPPMTLTPTPTFTPGADASVRFWADDDKIDKGDCTDLHWEVSNIDRVYLDGEGVVGQGKKEVCPKETTTYELKVVLLDGTEQKHTVKVKVEDKEPEETPQPSNTPEPQASATPLSIPTTPVPATDPPPTPEPTSEPTVEPTEEPTPEPTEEPTTTP